MPVPGGPVSPKISPTSPPSFFFQQEQKLILQGLSPPFPHSLPKEHMPQFLNLLVAKLNSAYAAGKRKASPRLVPAQCPCRLQCSESPKSEALGSDLSTHLSSPSPLFVPSVDIMVRVEDPQSWLEGPTIDKMPFMKQFLPEKH